MYQMGVLSSISTIKNGYTYLHGFSDRDETHYKMGTIHIDYILSQFEKFNYFTGVTDFFSKYRVFPFIGLASGFLLNHDCLLRANISP